MDKITFIPYALDGSIGAKFFVNDMEIEFRDKHGYLHIVPCIQGARKAIENIGSYECYLYNCTCGWPECAGVKTTVVSSNEHIQWIMTHPGEFTFTFEREQYIQAFIDYQNGVRYLTKRFTITDRWEYIKALTKPLGKPKKYIHDFYI